MNILLVALLAAVPLISRNMILTFAYNNNLAWGQSNEELLKAYMKQFEEELAVRKNMSTPAPQPILFDTDFTKYTVSPFPLKGQILIDISNYEVGLDCIFPDCSWSGSVLYGDGDITSFDGNEDDAILVDCKEGQPYSVTIQKGGQYGDLSVVISTYKNDTNDKVIDSGHTNASYGIVGLNGRC